MLAVLAAVGLAGGWTGKGGEVWGRNWWPREVLRAEFELGRRLAREGVREDWERIGRLAPRTGELSGVEIVFSREKRTIGWWSDGFRRLETEWVLELTPQVVSRWLGWLSAREGWVAGEEAGRWATVLREVGGRTVFVVCLSSFPTRARFGVLGEERPGADETRDVRFVLEGEGGVTEVGAEVLRERRGRSRGEVEGVRWWESSRLGPVLGFSFAGVEAEPLVPRGDYRRVWWWVEVGEDLGLGPVALRVLSTRKVRVAEFGG